MTYKQIMERLQKHKGRWPEIALRGGVSYRTLKKVGSGKTTNPTIYTLAAIEVGLRGFR